MNKESKAASRSQNKSIFISIEQFMQRQTKRTFVVGALICMSATAMSAIASSDNSRQTARNLISNSTQQTSNLPRDVQSLREQLIEKTRELQEYKASIFRTSHPQDHAKITELNQRIAELEKNKQELLEKINAQESELARAKRQMNGLEVASDALTDYIQKQRAIVEAEKNELLARIQAHEEDTRLDNERSRNEKLMIDLVVLTDTIATYENHIASLEQDYNKELQDALQEAAMLKFELADKRKQADIKEHELMVSSLNYMAIAHDLRKSHKASQNLRKSKINLTEMEVAALNSTIEDLKKENARIQSEYDKHVEIVSGGKQIMEKHFASRHVLANQLLEKDDALNAAVIYYEQVINEQTHQLQSLKESLSQAEADIHDLMHEKEQLDSQYTSEKQVFDEAIADGNSMIADAIQTHKQAINDHLLELQELQGHLELENLHHHLLSQERNQLSAELREHKQLVENTVSENLGLAVSIQEKEDALKGALNDSEESAKEFLRQIELLQEKLAQEEESRKELQASHDELFASHLNTTDYFESTLQDHQEAISGHENTKQALHLAIQEKENTLKSALSASEETANEYLEQILALKEKLAQEEEFRLELQNKHHELTATHHISSDLFEQALQEKEGAIADYQKNIEELELVLKEKEEELKIALMSSEDSSKEYLQQINTLKDKLAHAEDAFSELKKAHDELNADHSISSDTLKLTLHEKEEALAALEKNIHELNLELEEKEEALKSALSSSEASAKDYLAQIEQLNSKLDQQEKNLKDLKDTHEEFSANHEISTEYFEHTLQEKEEALRIALLSSEDSSKEYTEQIEALKEKLAFEQETVKELRKEHEELAANHTVSTNNFERNLQEKEEALRIALLSSEDSSKEYAEQIEALKEKLAFEQETVKELKKAHIELSDKYTLSSDHYESTLKEKDDHFTETSQALNSSIAEHLKHIEDLKEQLVLSEKAHTDLKNAHEDLGYKFSQTDTEKLALANVLQETEDSAHSKLTKLESEKLELEQELASLLQNLEQQRAIHAQYETKHKEQFNDIEALEQKLQSLAASHQEAGQKNSSLEQQLSALASQLEQKEHEFEQTSDQLRKLQQSNEQLNDQLANASRHIDTIKNQLSLSEQEAARAHLELHSHQLDAHQEVSQLKGQINDHSNDIDSLKRELAKLYQDYSEKVAKEIELEQAVHSLTVVAEQQDHALAQASSAFSMVQEYNHHLEADNASLKNRLSNQEVADRSGKNNSSSAKENQAQQPIPPALFNLLKPNK